MRKFLLLVITAVAFVACGDDDNVWSDNSGGGNRPVHASKLISRIIASGDTSCEGEVTINFTYDKQNRPETIACEMNRKEEDRVSICKTDIRINHGRSMARCEIKKYRDGHEFPDKSHKVVVLDDSGRAVSGDYTNFDFDGEGKYVRSEGQFELTYDRAGRLSRSSVNHLKSDNGFDALENRMTWRGNNLTEISYRANGTDHTDKAYYSDVLNKANLDLNWLCYAHNRGFANLTGDSENLFFLIGYCGKSSRNLPEMIVSQDSSKDHRCFYTYELDKEGYVSMIRVEKGNDEIIYRISYTK